MGDGLTVVEGIADDLGVFKNIGGNVGKLEFTIAEFWVTNLNELLKVMEDAVVCWVVMSVKATAIINEVPAIINVFFLKSD